MITEEQKRAIVNLYRNNLGKIEITMGTKDPCERTEIITKAERLTNMDAKQVVRLSINTEKIGDISEAIVMAEKYLDDIKKELQHEATHPNWVKALTAELNLIKFLA